MTKTQVFPSTHSCPVYEIFKRPKSSHPPNAITRKALAIPGWGSLISSHCWLKRTTSQQTVYGQKSISN